MDCPKIIFHIEVEINGACLPAGLRFKNESSGLSVAKANAAKLSMNGKLKVKGNMMKATAIEGVFKTLDPRAKL